MKNYKLWLCAAMATLSACSVANKSTNSADTATVAKTDSVQAPAKFLTAEMQIKDTIKVGEPVLLKFTVYNRTDSALQFCKWHTPFEPLLSKYLDVLDEKGEEANYKGAMAKRMMPPPASSYITVKDSLSETVDLLKAFDIKTPAKYTITYVGQNMSGLVVQKTVSFVYSK
jgi:hypothetical protein